LPDDIRRDLPKIAVGGSIYSDSSASRFVIVNGQLYHEGDSVAPDLVLQQIKLKSAVLVFRGYRYGITF
jgi:general secretion pathway protein B